MSYPQGSKYTGSYTPSGFLNITNQNDFVIEGKHFDGSGTKIYLGNCQRVIIRNCRFTQEANHSVRCIDLSGCKDVTVEHNEFEDIYSGVRASNCTGNIKFKNNDVKNINRAMWPNNETYKYTAQMIQFINCTGGGNEVSYNVNENIEGQSAPEDIINVYNSFGTSESPTLIKGNWLRGGGPNMSGGGILGSDGGGDWCIIEDNILVRPGQYGVAVVTGYNHVMRRNKIYSESKPWNNQGMLVWRAYNTAPNVIPIENVLVENNEVNYWNKNNVRASWWFQTANVPNLTLINNTHATFGPEILPTQILGMARAEAVNPINPIDMSKSFFSNLMAAMKGQRLKDNRVLEVYSRMQNINPNLNINHGAGATVDALITAVAAEVGDTTGKISAFIGGSSPYATSDELFDSLNT